MTSDFKRSPSKIWWASDSLEWREVSSSPNSQDSGFSDTDFDKISKPFNKPVNLSSNCLEKSTEKRLYTKNSPKVSRNLFSAREKRTKDDGHQYAKEAIEDKTRLFKFKGSSGVTLSRSLPCRKDVKGWVLNRSAPGVLEDIKDEEEVFGNHSLSSDCESELECLFNGALEAPQYSSTPKGRMRCEKGEGIEGFFRYQRERVIQNNPDPHDSVQKWMKEIQHHYEQECMTTLQSKSIAGELNQKVAHMATFTTTTIKNILSRSECIEQDYKNINNEKKHVGPLAQSLAGNIIDFFKTYSEVTLKLTKQYDAIRKASTEDLLNLIPALYVQWETSLRSVLFKEVKKLVDKLESPCSELDLRATTTGITSLCLRNENLIEVFTKSDIIPILLILCEKCEGSSMRSLLLRALSTMCSTTFAVRQFERFSGIQIITDTLDDPSRPEPERSEAVALLAQVTAPWIEDNHSIKGLQDHSRRLVKSLTHFTSRTKCCQNLLLCAAALANLSTMDPQCVKYMLHLDTPLLLLEAVSRRGPCASVYLLEQVATLLANMAALEAARRRLGVKAVEALLCFLRGGSVGEEVEKRLQQKAIIALSRLCGEEEAARQVVELGGVEKLVRMCREKEERFCNDAVLVATLATLRKIADACGRDVISVEDVQELVEPKLLDSFLAYSTQSESYV